MRGPESSSGRRSFWFRTSGWGCSGCRVFGSGLRPKLRRPGQAKRDPGSHAIGYLSLAIRSKYFSASNAAMQPKPEDVIA